MFPTQIEELVLARPELTAWYQLVVTRDGHLDEVEVLTELQSASAYAQQVLALSATLQLRIKNLVGISATVSLLAPSAIERTQKGKSRRVINKRTKTRHPRKLPLMWARA